MLTGVSRRLFTVIGIAQVEGLGLVICLNVFPVGWPAALILAGTMPRRKNPLALRCVMFE